MDDQRAGELFAHGLAAGGVGIDDGHPLLDVLQFFDEVVRDAAGTDDHDVVGAGLEDVQLAEEAFQLAGAGGQVNFVAFLQHRSAGGDDGLLAAGDRADQNFNADVAVQVAQLQTHQGVALVDAVLHQLKPLAAELLALDGAGETQHTGDLPRGGLLRVDDHGKAQLLAHKVELLFVLRVTDTRNSMRCTELFCYKAGQNIGLVAGGGGDEQVGAILKGVLLDVVAAAVARHTADIVDVYEALDQVRILVDNDNIVLFRRELFRQDAPDLARAYNHDSHSVSPFVSGRSGPKVYTSTVVSPL